MLPRLSDVPTAVKVSLAPGFAILMMAGIALCALWSQKHSTAALYSVMDQGQLQLRLAADSRSITAANGALYILMTRQAAGGSPDAAQASVGQVLAQLDRVKADLTALRSTLPPNLQPPINAVLRDLTLYRGGVTVVGSMLGIDFNSAASFLQPFQTNYTRMTSTLARASDEISAQAFASAAASSAEASHLGRLMLAAVALTLVAVILVSWLVVTLIARTIAGISSATERLAGGQTDLDLESMQRRDDFGPIVRSLSVFQTNQRHMIAMRAEQEAMKEREEAARAAAEREREDSMAQLRSVIAAMSLGLNNLAKGNLIFRLQEWFPLPFKGLRMDFNEANEKLRVTMDAIAQNTSGIRTSADEITQASDDLARRTEQQAATLEQTAAALDEITATVRRTADGAAEAREVVRAARSDAEHSGTIVREAVAAMSGIEASSMKIANIVGVIDDIAFQTNLLALNAGVEAARAGDAGRGFAVVATEVRALSQRSADAAKEIKALISASGQQVETGVKRVGDTGTSLTRIVERVERLNVLVAAIAGSAQEQATGLAEVNGAINQMDKVTQQNAAMVEQTTAASHALASEAKELARLVGQFSTSSAQPKDAAQQTKQNAFAT